MLSLASTYISKIRGVLEGLTDMEKILYSKNGLIKYDYIYFEYALGHVYYINNLFFKINVIFKIP